MAFFQCHTTHGLKVMTIWLDHLISCRIWNEIFWIDNSHNWNLESTGQFIFFRICINKWMKLGFRFSKCYRKRTFVRGDVETVIFPKFEQCVLQAVIVLLKLNIVFLSKETHPTKLVIVFLDISLWAPGVCKNQAWVLDNLGYKLDRKISTSPCN